MKPTLSLILLVPLLANSSSASSCAPGPLFQEEVAQKSAAELIAEGRQLFDAGQAEEAEPLFSLATTLEPENFDANFWLIRSWIELKRVNDALDATDVLIDKGKQGVETDYLCGMAFHAKAVGYMATGVDGGSISMSFGDSMEFLTSATTAEPDRFADAFYPLAEASWHSQDLERGLKAANEACKRFPKDAKAHFLKGRILMSQYTVARGDESNAEAAAGMLEAGLAAFLETAKVLGEPKESDRISLLAQTWVQVAYCRAWQSEHEKLVQAISSALGWNPGDVDLSWAQSQMTDNKEFITCLDEGGKQYAKRYGDKHSGDATLRWWLGWAYFSELQYADAEREFTDSVNKFPSYVNCWFYIAMSRYQLRNFDGSIEAFVKHWTVAPTDAVQSLSANKGANLAILDYLVGQCAKSGKNIEAGILSEMQAEVAQDVDRYWNNVGLFFRDGGEAIARTKKKGALEEAMKHYESSWAGYQRALQLQPDNPAYLNDGAVLLHYYLDRELERAAEMYRQATTNAEKFLADENLSKEKRDLFSIALRDSKNNLKLLLKKLEKGSQER